MASYSRIKLDFQYDGRINTVIGFWTVNLLVPEEPQQIEIKTPLGIWALKKAAFYDKSKAAISDGQCANTYALEHPVSMDDGSAACDTAFDELTPLFLGMSYLTGLSVTAKTQLPHSEISIIQLSDHWPRERSMGSGNPVVDNAADFSAGLEAFINSWAGPGQQEKVLLLIHHWLDALACWSLEDCYLSATTLLQVIAATEGAIQARSLTYYTAVDDASQRVGIAPLSRDFKDMRNVLIHEGRLIGGAFQGTSFQDCAAVAANVLNWFDEYIHSVLGVGPVRRQRFTANAFTGLNSYSIP